MWAIPTKLQSVTVIAIVLFTALSPLQLFAQAEAPEIIRVDSDFVELELGTARDGSYELYAESRRTALTAVDWMTYVVCLQPEDHVGLSKKIQDKRAIFSSEEPSIEMLYVPSKNYLQLIDVSELVSNAVVDSFSGLMDLPEPHADIHGAECPAHLVRSYSGAFGLADDREERAFVRENVDAGETRLFAAFVSNVVTGGIDAISVFVPSRIAGNPDAWSAAIGEAVAVTLGHNTLNSLSESEAADEVEIITIVKDVGVTALDTLFSLSAEHAAVEASTKSLLSRTSSFVGNVFGAAVNVVDGLGKVSKLGQVGLRISGMTVVSPLETAYVMSTPASVLEEQYAFAKASDEPKSTEALTEPPEVETTEETAVETATTPPAEPSEVDTPPDQASISPAAIEAEELTLRFVNQYNHPYTKFSGHWIDLYDIGGTEVETLASKEIEERSGTSVHGFEAINPVPPGEYIVNIDDSFGNLQMPGNKYAVRRYTKGGRYEFSAPQSGGNWYIEVEVPQTRVEYCSLRRDVLTITVKDSDGPVPRPPTGGGNLTITQADGTKLDAWKMFSSEDSGVGRFSLAWGGCAMPGKTVASVTIDGYEEESFTFILPDISTWSDEEVLAKDPIGSIDLGTITLSKE